MTSILYPYPTVHGADPTLRITRLLVDDVAKPGLLKSDDCTVVLHEERLRWQRAELSLELACEPEAVEAFEREHGAVEVTVTANCAPTNHRHAAPLRRAGSNGSLWTGTLELDRDNTSERTYVTAALTATVCGITHRPVATSHPWTVYADEPQSLRFQGTLRVSWVDFGGPDAPPLAREFPKSTHIVDFDGSSPRLLLNAGFEGLFPLLGDRKDRVGEDRALHDFKRTSIALATWLALITEALADVQGDPSDPEDELAWPPTEWKAEVLKYVLPRIYPDKNDRDLLTGAAGDWRRVAAGQFLARAEAVVGELIGANEFVRRYVQTYDREAVK